MSLKRDFKENLQFIHHRHHTQHEQSVNAAKQTLQERLSKLDVQNGYGQSSQYGNSYGSSGSQKYVVGCSTCYGGSENRVLYNSRYLLELKNNYFSSENNLSLGATPNDFFTQFFDLLNQALISRKKLLHYNIKAFLNLNRNDHI